MTKQTFLLSALLVFAFAFSGWLVRQTAMDFSPANNKPDTPDAFMEQVTYYQMDENGSLHTQINSPKLIHYATNDSSNFTDPQVTIYNPSHQPWNITANFGQSQQGTTQVHLWEKVVVHQPAGPNNDELTMTTPSLIIFPNTQSAVTDQAVTITQPGTVVNSVGLRADLNKGEVQLLSQARGIYEATTNSKK